MRSNKFAATLLTLVFLLAQTSTAFGSIILGDAKSGSGSCETKLEKVDHGVIITLTGVIITFTGVIITFSDEMDSETINCGIILTD